MAKTVGFACSIKPQWIKKTIQLVEENLDEANFKEQLNEYLGFEIDGPTRLRKTREILMNMWFYDRKGLPAIRREALRLIDKYPEYFAPINLCILYLAYPVVADICKFMGRIFESHDDVTNAMLKQKLFDEWGERGALDTTCRRVTLTLKEFELLEAPSKTRYVLRKMSVTNSEVVDFMLSVVMKIDDAGYYSFTELNDMGLLFLFDYVVSKEHIMMDDRFTVSTFGGEVVVSLKDVQ